MQSKGWGRGDFLSHKRRAVERMLRDEEWAQWSNVEIARRCAVSESLVRSMKPIFVLNEDSERKVTRNGTAYTQNTAHIGAKSPYQEETG